MRKPRNFDAELKALESKAHELRAHKIGQSGELAVADGLISEELADALVAIIETSDTAKREAWAKRGRTIFEGAR
jgi:hypothetical protein